MFDPEFLVDLRVNNAGRPEQYEVFLEECQKYISEEVETAVDDRRHDAADVNGDIVTHLAAFLSVRDLYDQFAKRVPEGTPLPSKQWLRLQFWPQRKNAAVSRFFTGKIKLKFMVQARQLRKFHEDAHYASALFKYEKAFACKYKDFTTFVCMDDKHACKVGEPKCPVAAVDRGKRVIVGLNQSLEVSDHDHTKLSIIPSVILKVDLPDSTDGSFYRGEVCVSIKEHCFQPSTPIRHACELKTFLNSIDDRKEILCLYTDGEPDHRTTYYSVKIGVDIPVPCNGQIYGPRCSRHKVGTPPPPPPLTIAGKIQLKGS